MLTDVKADKISGNLEYDEEVFELDDTTEPVLADGVELLVLEKDTGYVELACEEPKYFSDDMLISIPFTVLKAKEYSEFAMVNVVSEANSQPTLVKNYMKVEFVAPEPTIPIEPTLEPAVTMGPTLIPTATPESTVEPTETPDWDDSEFEEEEEEEEEESTPTPKPVENNTKPYVPKPTNTPTPTPTPLPTAVPAVVHLSDKDKDKVINLPKTGQDLATFYLVCFGGVLSCAALTGTIVYIARTKRQKKDNGIRL